MSIAHFNSAAASANITVLISNQTVANIFSLAAASAGVKLTRGGQFQTGYDDNDTTPVYSDVGGSEWASREYASVGDAYQAKMTALGGAVSSGTTGSWLPLTGDLSWEVHQFGNGTNVFTGTLEIRLGTGTVLDSASISLTAFVDVI